jgi:hypothetical protein
MVEQMTEEQLFFQERLNTGTSWTRNEFFEKNGYLVIKNLWDSQELYRSVPEERGQINYWGKGLDQFTYTEVEQQVEGSLACYWHPQYRSIHSSIRLKLEKELGRKLYNTYYYDRFYFPGQALTRHADRDACEISVTVHISSNLKTPWPIWIKTPDTYADKKKTLITQRGENRSVILNAGDGMVYKGCERPHWREPMPTEHTRTWYGKRVEKEGLYYHQIFFHYVLADGQRVQCANDMAK